MSSKIVIILIISVLVLGGVGYWLYQGNSYSKEVLRLEIFGPETAAIGEEIEYSVRLKNNGDVRLDEPRLVFEYPISAQPVGGDDLRVTKESEDLDGSIYPGQEKIFRFKARLFGKQGDIQEAKALASYRPRNLKARYVSRTSHLITIGEVPLTFEFDIPSGVGDRQELNFSLNYFSSVNFSLADLEIRITYPSGFELKETDPRGISDNEWRISLLNKAEGDRIDISGSLKGETGTTKAFKSELGIWQRGEFIVLKETTKQVKIIEPSLYITQRINNSTDYVANSSDLLHYEITFRNVGTAPLQHLFLAYKLNGDLFDFKSIRSPDGKSESGDNSVIWDWHDVAKLQFLDAGEEGMVEFWIDLKDDARKLSKAKLENEVILGQSRKKFVTKVNANLEISQSAHIDDEIFGSQPDFPLEAGKDSFFTIIWKAKNYYNSLENAKVSAILPPQARLTGKVEPQKLTFDPDSREVVWAIGDLEENQGIDEPLQLAFQIALKPTSSQEGKFATLVRTATFSGLDQWTEQQIEATSTLVTTEVFGSDGRVK